MAKMSFLLYFALVFLSIVGVYGEDYDFTVEIDHNFASGEEIECNLDWGSSDRDYSFDEDSSSSDLKMQRSTNDEIILDCDSDVDNINLVVEYSGGGEIFDIDFDDVDGFEFDMRDYEYDYHVELDHNFEEGQVIDCILEIDSKDDEEFDVDENSDNEDFEYEGAFFERLLISCSDDVDEIMVKVDNPDGFDIFKHVEIEGDEVEVDLDGLVPQFYTFSMQFYENFGEQVDCDVEVDSKYRTTYSYSKNERLSNMEIELGFGETVEVDCEEIIDSAIAEVLNSTYFEDESIYFVNISGVRTFFFDLNDFVPVYETKVVLENETAVNESVEKEDEVINETENNVSSDLPMENVGDTTSNGVGSEVDDGSNDDLNLSMQEVENESGMDESSESGVSVLDDSDVNLILVVFMVFITVFLIIVVVVLVLKG